MSAGFRGYISRQHTVWCGECGNWEQVDAHLKADAEKLVRRLGWKYIEKSGWSCPECQKCQKEKP